MCLNSFLVGLKEPLGSNIRAMRPDSLATALACCIKEQNIYYQQTNDKYTHSQRFKRQYDHFNPYPPTNQMNQRYKHPKPYRQAFAYNQTNPSKYFNNQYQNFIRYPNFRTNNPNNNSYPNTQNNFNNEPRSKSLQSNPFNQTQNDTTYPKPEPMDTSSGTSRFTARSTNTNRFPQRSRDVNCIDQVFDEPYEEESLCNIDDTPNFRTCASKSRRDI